MKPKTKRTLKRIALILAIAVMGGVLGAAAVGGLSSMKKEVNPDNLIKVEDYAIKDKDDLGRGIDATVKEDGTIKLTGRATSDNEFLVTSIVLEPGKYTISGCNSNKDASGLKAVFGSSEYYAGTAEDTFEIESTTTVNIYAYVKEDTVCINKTIRPVLVEGDTPGEFYA